MSLHLHYRQQLNLLSDFQNYFLLYRPDSVESLLEVIINALGKRININKSDDVFYKFTSYSIQIFRKYLTIKIFTINDKK
jgi:hypothetical protein